MVKVRSQALWIPVFLQGHFAALRILGETRMCLPLFSSPALCQEWIDGLGFTGVVAPSFPLWPRQLVRVLDTAMDVGFELFTLNPPYGAELMLETAPIENLLAQAEEKIA